MILKVIMIFNRPGFILRHKIAGLARSYSDLLKPSRSLITASSLQNSSSPISSAEVRRKPRCREFCREFPHQKWTKTKVVFIILRGMGVIWKSDLTCLNYSQVISCDITVAISTTSTRSNTLLGGWNPYIPRPQPRNCLHQTLVSAQRSPWQHPGEQKTQGCPKAGSPQIPVCFSPMSQGGHHQNCHELDHSGANDLKKKIQWIIISLYQFSPFKQQFQPEFGPGKPTMQRATGPHATPCPFSACSMGVTLMLRRRLPISSASVLTCLDHFDTDILREIGVLLWCIDKWVNDDLCSVDIIRIHTH